jgi:hypothetical protein
VFDLATTQLNWTTVEVLLSHGSSYSKSLKNKFSELIKNEEDKGRKTITPCIFHK